MLLLGLLFHGHGVAISFLAVVMVKTAGSSFMNLIGPCPFIARGKVPRKLLSFLKILIQNVQYVAVPNCRGSWRKAMYIFPNFKKIRNKGKKLEIVFGCLQCLPKFNQF